jgi:hypothetical protein
MSMKATTTMTMWMMWREEKIPQSSFLCKMAESVGVEWTDNGEGSAALPCEDEKEDEDEEADDEEEVEDGDCYASIRASSFRSCF